jgi:hypothetical protein
LFEGFHRIDGLIEDDADRSLGLLRIANFQARRSNRVEQQVA